MIPKSNTTIEHKIVFGNCITDELYNLSIPIDKFENCLHYFVEKEVKNRKNFFSIYQFENKYFKIFQDGSCFCYEINNQTIKDFNTNYLNKIKPVIITSEVSNLKNDSFPIKLVYHFSSSNYQIIFTKNDMFDLIFEKNFTNNKNKYQIYFRSNKKDYIKDNIVIETIQDIEKILVD